MNELVVQNQGQGLAISDNTKGLIVAGVSENTLRNYRFWSREAERWLDGRSLSDTLQPIPPACTNRAKHRRQSHRWWQRSGSRPRTQGYLKLSEESSTCSSAIYRRRTLLLTPDESGNYNRGSIKGFVGNNDRCSLLKCVSPTTNIGNESTPVGYGVCHPST